MSLIEVLNCPTRICGHGFILALMLTHGSNFTLDQIEGNQTLLHPITVVNVKTFQGPSEYIGRPMPNRNGSPLANKFKVQPFGPYERNESVLVHYRSWLWKEMQNPSGSVYRELIRLASIAKNKPLNLACWCAPQTCHGDVVKKAIEFVIKEGAA
jgi:hypothetical protein